MPSVSPNDRDPRWYTAVTFKIFHSVSISVKIQAHRTDTFPSGLFFGGAVDIHYQQLQWGGGGDCWETDTRALSAFQIRFYIRVNYFMPEPELNLIGIIWPDLPGKLDAAYEASIMDEVRFFKGNVYDCFCLYKLNFHLALG